MSIRLVPRPRLVFGLQFAVSIVHGIRRAVKNGKGQEHLSCDMNVRWTLGGRGVPDNKFVHSKPVNQFLTVLAESF